MPLNEYECEKCSHKFEVIQKFSDAPIEKCTREGCDGKVKKLIFASGIVFKGSGFYLTDYSDKMKKDKNEKPETKKEAKQETKQETKKEAKTKTTTQTA